MTFAGVECALSAKLAQDPKLKLTRGVNRCTIAAQVFSGGHGGERYQLVKLTAIGSQANEFARTLVKGDRIYVEGRCNAEDGHGCRGAAWRWMSIGSPSLIR